MKEQLISFEIAKLAKEKGFDWKCQHYFSSAHPEIGIDVEEGFNHAQSSKGTYVGPKDILIDRNSYKGGIFSRPTQSLLQRWLREKHKIDVLPSLLEMYFQASNPKYVTKISHYLRVQEFTKDYGTYEEALEEGLQKALKLI